MNLRLANIMLAMIFLCGLNSQALAEVVTIPARLNKANQYSVQARINDSDPIWCIVDSGGGDRLYLDRDRAAKLGIKSTSTGQSAGPGDREMKQDLRSQVTVEVSGLKFVNQPVLLQSRPHDEYACVIGQTVFRRYIVEVDYEIPAIRLHHPKEFRYSGPGKTVPFNLEEGSPFVTAVLTTPNGKSFAPKIAVDTGCGSALIMLSKNFITNNDLMNQGLPLAPASGGWPKSVLFGRADKLSVGPFDILQPTVLLQQGQGFGGDGGPDGLLCGDFLRRFKLIFNYQTQTLLMEPVRR